MLTEVIHVGRLLWLAQERNKIHEDSADFGF